MYFEILPGFYISSDFLPKKKFDLVYSFRKLNTNYIYIHINDIILPDKNGNLDTYLQIQNNRIFTDFYRKINKIISNIHENLSNLKKICLIGNMQKTGTIVCAYFMKYGELSFSKCFITLQEKYPFIFKKKQGYIIEYKKTLKLFEKSLC